MEKKFLAIIPARGGSKGIPKKNIKILLGKPLIRYTIEAGLKSKYLDKVVVSTDDNKIAEISKKSGAEIPCLRPKILAQDGTPTLPVLQQMAEFLKKRKNYNPFAVVLLQPTSPLRTAKHIDEAIRIFLRHPEADSLVSVVRAPHNMNPYSLMKLEDDYLENYIPQKKLILQRQKKPIVYARNGPAICITKTERLDQYIFGGKIIPYIMSEIESFDIDDLEDFQIIESIMKNL